MIISQLRNFLNLLTSIVPLYRDFNKKFRSIKYLLRKPYPNCWTSSMELKWNYLPMMSFSGFRPHHRNLISADMKISTDTTARSIIFKEDRRSSSPIRTWVKLKSLNKIKKMRRDLKYYSISNHHRHHARAQLAPRKPILPHYCLT